ncbi:hypothetical protein CYMTET_22843, partial [Cymbomonas tetramitiformis]
MRFRWRWATVSFFCVLAIKQGASLTQMEHLGGTGCTPNAPCPACYGDCDSNSDCIGDLLCFQRESGDPYERIPGCTYGGAEDPEDEATHDYCYNISAHLAISHLAAVVHTVFAVKLDGLPQSQVCVHAGLPQSQVCVRAGLPQSQ